MHGPGLTGRRRRRCCGRRVRHGEGQGGGRSTAIAAGTARADHTRQAPAEVVAAGSDRTTGTTAREVAGRRRGG